MTDAARYAAVADRFGARVREVAPDRWNAPTPCAGWRARDIVGHLAEWVPGFFAAYAALDAPSVAAVHDDPAAAWFALDRVLRGWLDDAAIADRVIASPMGELTVAAAVSRFVTADVLIHTWDLARAAGLDDRLDPHEVERMADGIEAIDAALRASGHYGPRVDVAATADPQDRLLAFLGRDPTWTPPIA